MAKRTCATCRHFAETVAKPAPASRGECRRYPKPIERVSRQYWCGEWKHK